jgi:ketosteroid isomerase-like protein
MKTTIAASIIFLLFSGTILAQKTEVKTVVDAEQAFNKAVAKKGIKDGFLSVLDDEGIVFRPNAVNAKDFYTSIQKQNGGLSWEPKFARISANGDLGFTAGPYVYQNSANDTSKVFGHYVSIWRKGLDGKLKLLIDLGIQHPEAEQAELVDFQEPDLSKVAPPSTDPFGNKKLILYIDRVVNSTISKSTMATYKEFFSPEGRYYFPGFEPLVGRDKIMQFVNNEALSMIAETTDAGRSESNDLAYSYGKAQIKKGNITGKYNYVRIWELDQSKKWNILLEVFSAVDN